MSNTRNAILAATLLLAAIGSGCATSEWLKKLFIRQSEARQRLTYSIMYNDDKRNRALAEKLYAIEDRLSEACGPLQRAGRKKMFGEEIDFGLKLAITNTYDDCEAEVNSVEEELEDLGLPPYPH